MNKKLRIKTFTLIVAMTFLLIKPPAVVSQSSSQTRLRYTGNSSPVKEIKVICKTHFNIGYTHRVKEIVQYYRTSMIDNALDIVASSKDMPKEQQFAWTAPGRVMSRVLEDWPGQSPERRKKPDQVFRSGKFLTLMGNHANES